jgi:hypothetical protein
MKRCLRGQSFEAADEFLSASEVISMGIDDRRSTLDGVFLEWMERLRICIATNGEHFEET